MLAVILYVYFRGGRFLKVSLRGEGVSFGRYVAGGGYPAPFSGLKDVGTRVQGVYGSGSRVHKSFKPGS